jgi:hypothetical protein
MKTKVIITETQLKTLKKFIHESSVHSDIVKEMVLELNANYTPTENYVKGGGEYSTKKMVKVNIDDELISPKALFDYFKFKYNMGSEFTKQVITDWINGKINDEYSLSKNVTLNENT